MFQPVREEKLSNVCTNERATQFIIRYKAPQLVSFVFGPNEITISRIALYNQIVYKTYREATHIIVKIDNSGQIAQLNYIQRNNAYQIILLILLSNTIK